MAKLRHYYLLVSTAVSVVLTTGMTARAYPTFDEVAAAVPLPETAEVRPLTPADVAPKATVPTQPQSVTPPATDQKAQETAGVPTDPDGQKIKELLAVKGDRMFGGKKERAAVEAFYVARNYAPAWTSDGAANARAKAAIAYLATVDSEGLDPADYQAPNFKTSTAPDQLADADLRMTATLLTYARHAQNGRVHPSRTGSDIAYNAEPLDPADALAKIADGRDVAKTLADFNPPHALYKALKAKLVELRGGKGGAAPVRIAGGPVLKLGKSDVQDTRVPALRQRLGLGAKDDEAYDRELADAVTAFQKEHGLAANGQLSSATIDALNGPRRDRSHDIDVILANMERWRWLPRDLGKAYSMLNVPDFTLKVYRDEAVLWQTRVVVGKPGTPTPLLTETMKYITVNPTWNVPPSIVYNEYLPAVRQDPTVLARYGLHMSYNRDGSVHISQPPGDRNALGRIRFNFPNKFLVYQHDTPDKNLFALAKRAFSHGCMRVQDPVKYAEVMTSLGTTETYSVDRIRKMIANGGETDIKFTTPIPVHITYQTAFVDDAGSLQFREDVYGRDARLLALLKSGDRQQADVPVAQAQPSYGGGRARSSQVAGGPQAYYGGQSFFGMLFGGGHQVPPAAVPGRRNYYR